MGMFKLKFADNINMVIKKLIETTLGSLKLFRRGGAESLDNRNTNFR
jgi:hypothetical protein